MNQCAQGTKATGQLLPIQKVHQSTFQMSFWHFYGIAPDQAQNVLNGLHQLFRNCRKPLPPPVPGQSAPDECGKMKWEEMVLHGAPAPAPDFYLRHHTKSGKHCYIGIET